MFSWEEIGRKNPRLRGYDYAKPGTYFITICTWENREIFGDIRDGIMILNPLGIIARDDWIALPSRRKNIALDEYVVMPNHFHAIIRILDTEPGDASIAPTPHTNVRATLASPPRSRKSKLHPNSLGSIIGGFKSGVTRQIRKINQRSTLPIWHWRYYDSIVKDDDSLENIRQYIRNNPKKWHQDRNTTKIGIPE